MPDVKRGPRLLRKFLAELESFSHALLLNSAGPAPIIADKKTNKNTAASKFYLIGVTKTNFAFFFFCRISVVLTGKKDFSNPVCSQI